MSEGAWIAIGAGVLSAIALPLGAFVGMATRAGARVNSALMAFGAGALLFALSVEIVGESLHESGFASLAMGALLGGLAFDVANQTLSRRGGFLRKVAVAARHLSREKRREAEALLQRLASVHLLQALPPEEVARLAPSVRQLTLKPGQELFHEGDAGSSLYLIESGEVEVTRADKVVAVLSAGETVGEIALITGAPRTATILALVPTRLLQLPKNAFDTLLTISPDLRQRVHELIALRTEDLRRRLLAPSADVEEWQARATARLRSENFHATRAEIEQAAAARGHAPATSIWAGNLLDAIPEAMVLGTTVSGGALSWPLLASVFIANFPEAMSSAGIMRAAGLRRSQILWMWGSIVPVAGVCAAIGYVFLSGMTAQAFGVIEGVAAGALLVMIAETMLPEAYERGGAIVGLSTLLGFLTALAVRAFT